VLRISSSAAQRAARAARAASHDEVLAAARLELLEKQSALEGPHDEHEKTPPQDERRIRGGQLTLEVAQFQHRAGDPEKIIDRHRWLPYKR
jgi:hypothetical protein